MDEKMCKKCNVHMDKKGKMTSGNAYFDIWVCPSCNAEEMECTGLVKQ